MDKFLAEGIHGNWLDDITCYPAIFVSNSFPGMFFDIIYSIVRK
jgi:hypothetical protein